MVRRTAAQVAADEAQARRRRLGHVRRTYGLEPAALEALEAHQAAELGRPGGPARCWGCGRATGASKALAVDHNHRTGEVRMLLCGPCNQMVGRFRDNPTALVRLGLALVYPPSRVALARPGALPGWVSSDPELAQWLDDHLDERT